MTFSFLCYSVNHKIRVLYFNEWSSFNRRVISGSINISYRYTETASSGNCNNCSTGDISILINCLRSKDCSTSKSGFSINCYCNSNRSNFTTFRNCDISIVSNLISCEAIISTTTENKNSGFIFMIDITFSTGNRSSKQNRSIKKRDLIIYMKSL